MKNRQTKTVLRFSVPVFQEKNLVPGSQKKSRDLNSPTIP